MFLPEREKTPKVKGWGAAHQAVFAAVAQSQELSWTEPQHVELHCRTTALT
jgi:hypothetical protein